MSGAGRKHRAKHLTQQYLDATGWVGPKEGETLAVCLESPHEQHVRVLLLLAHPTEASRVLKETAVTETERANSAVPSGSSPSEAAPHEAPEALPLDKEQFVFLPGKFHKVIWLSIKDIVVVADGTVTFKPSPEQMENFMKDPARAGWRERIAAAQHRAEDERVAVQRMPQYGATTQTTTSVLTGPQVHREARPSADAEVGEDGEESIEDMVNPNWGNIKHHQQFFYGMDDEESDEQEEEEAEDDEWEC